MISRLLSPCLFNHGQPIYSRVDGVLGWQCERCHAPLGPVLAGEMITTPLAQVVAGEPKTKVMRANVSPWKVSTR